MVEYTAVDLWYGQAYKPKSFPTSEKLEEMLGRIVKLRDTRLRTIEEIVGGEFQPSMQPDEYFSPADFPPLTFKKYLDGSEVRFKCGIYFTLFSQKQQKAKYNMIWVTIGANSRQSSEGLKDFFDSMEEYAKDIWEVIKGGLYSIGVMSDKSIEHQYPITIRNIGNNEIRSEDGVFRSFETKNEEEANNLLKIPEVRAIVSDLLTLNGKSINQEFSIGQLKTIGINWQLVSYPGNINFIYGSDFQKNYAQIAGFSNVKLHKDLHHFFRLKVPDIQYGL